MTTPDSIEAELTEAGTTPWYKSKKMWIAIPLGLALIWMNYAIYTPASAIAGMLTDSCSGDSNAYLMWNIWLGYLWPVVMLIGSLIPPFLILKNNKWWKVVLSVLICGVASIVWYFLWVPVLFITGC
jgi:hypothetical protein